MSIDFSVDAHRAPRRQGRRHRRLHGRGSRPGAGHRSRRVECSGLRGQAGSGVRPRRRHRSDARRARSRREGRDDSVRRAQVRGCVRARGWPARLARDRHRRDRGCRSEERRASGRRGCDARRVQLRPLQVRGAEEGHAVVHADRSRIRCEGHASRCRPGRRDRAGGRHGSRPREHTGRIAERSRHGRPGVEDRGGTGPRPSRSSTRTTWSATASAGCSA